MYCQSCGAENSEDARFCNMCGGTIAQAGQAGGPVAGDATRLGVGKPDQAQPSTSKNIAPGPGGLPPSMPYPGGGDSMLSVSLAGIGVRSSGRTWTFIAALALALVALGALGSYLAAGDQELAETGTAEPEDLFVIGTPLPSGDDAPVVDAVSGDPPEDLGAATPEATKSRRIRRPRQPSGGVTQSSGTMSVTPTGSTTMSATPTGSTTMSATTMSGTTMSGTTMSGTTMAAAPTGTMTATMTAGTGTGTAGTGTAGTGTAGTGTAGTGTAGTGTIPDEVPEERDIELDMYGSRVRFVIRRYYAARAQTCFDRATRNDPAVSGTVIIDMTIGSAGTVTRTVVGRNTTGDMTLGTCLSNQVRTWRLPPPPGGELDMQMPFSR